jgi:hypothetical protein
LPLSNETVPNKPLAAHELRQIIEKDVHDILMKDGMFTGVIAYGRVSYRVTVEVLLDNIQMPRHTSLTESKARPKDVLRTQPELAAIKPHPLDPRSPEAIVTSTQRERAITSPNLARMENGLPLTVEKREGDRMVEKQVGYEASDIPALAEPGFKDTNMSEKSAGRLGMASPPVPPTPEAEPEPVGIPGEAIPPAPEVPLPEVSEPAHAE